MATPNISSLQIIPPQSGIPAINPDGTFTPAWLSFFHQTTAPKINYINSTYINTINTTPASSGVIIKQSTGTNSYTAAISLVPTLENISTTPNGTGALVNNGSGSFTYTPITNGTVTSLSVATANGFSGTVLTPGTTPVITLSTTVSGVLKGSGGSIVAAISGTDYYVPGGALGTPSSGNLVNCTFPTLNQNTTGYAAGLAGGVLGSVPYQSAANTTAFLAPNTTNNPMFLQSQGTGSAGLAPTWTSNLTVNSLVCSSSLSTTTYIYCGIQGTGEQSGTYYYQNNVQTPTVSSSIIDASGTVPTVGNLWLHHHSTVSPSTLYGSRSNSNTVSHAPLTNGQAIFAIVPMGSTQSGSLSYEYQPFGQILFSADNSGTISATSAPGQLGFYTTPNGSLTPTLALTINNSQVATFASTVTGTSFNGVTGLYASLPGMDSGSGSIGSSTLAAPGNHIHPTDTSRAASNATLILGSTTLTLGGTTTSVAGLTLTGAALNGSLGATTPSTISATTGTFSGQITSTLATGTAPFAVTSTTPVTNLSIGGNAATATNASQLLGSTWASPAAIGSATPAAGSFTTGIFNQIVTANNGINFGSGNTGVLPGSIYSYSGVGLVNYAKTGSTYDWGVINPGASSWIIYVPTGTLNTSFGGNISAVGGTFSGAITSAGKTVPTETDSTWTPTFTGLTIVGTQSTAGKYKQIGNVIYWVVVVSSTTTTASTAGTTSFTLPTTPASSSTLTAVNTSTVASYGVGILNATAAYSPTWAATASVTLSGFYFTT